MKKILLIIVLIFAFSFILCANQKSILQKNSDNGQINSFKELDFNFIESIELEFNNINYNKMLIPYASKTTKSSKTAKSKKNSNSKKVKGFTGMAVAGTVLFGVSWFFTIPGIALIAYGIENSEKRTDVRIRDEDPFGATRTSWEHYYEYDYTLAYIGAGLLGFGCLLLIAGLPLMIVGWVMRAKYKKKVSFFINSDTENSQVGLSIKIGNKKNQLAFSY